MKKILDYTVKSNIKLTNDIYEMVLVGDGSWVNNPGQFINIKCGENYLRRPISICDWSSDSLTIVYRTVGKGTNWLANLTEGQLVNCLIGLGNGFKTLESQKALVVGGGVGIPPLYGLTKKLVSEGKDVTVLLGYRGANDEFYLEKFKQLTDKVYCSSDDGTLGLHGNVVDLMKSKGLQDIPYYSCGPVPMLKGLRAANSANGLISLESRMGCGFGACMGCSMETAKGAVRVCKEGPVFASEDLLW